MGADFEGIVVATVERAPRSVEAMGQVLSYLVIERQELRSRGADRIELEANRQAIVAMQWQLGRALGEQHGPRLRAGGDARPV
jgi:hypothetical protein